MTDQELDRLVLRQAPIDDATLDALDLEDAQIELIGEIVALPDDGVSDLNQGRARRKRRLLARGVGGAVAACAACALAVVLLVGGGSSRPEFASAAVAVAEANSRLLVDKPGWTIARTAEFTVDDGEMVFSGDGDPLDGKGELELHWYPAELYRAHLRDRASNAVRGEASVLGREAAQFRHPGSGLDEIVTVLPPNGANFVELRGDLGNAARYSEVLASLKAVDVDAWLTAIRNARSSPGASQTASATPVLPSERAGVVDEMLEGIPLPPGLPVATLREGDVVMSRYDLAALVSGAVACRWLDDWTAARATGNGKTAEQAIAAMRTARDWPLFTSMTKGERAGYPSVLWDYADAMRAPAAAKARHNVDIRFYSNGLGCREAREGGG